MIRNIIYLLFSNQLFFFLFFKKIKWKSLSGKVIQTIFGKKLQLEFLKYGKLNSKIQAIEQG